MVFALNTVVGFACAMGVDMGFNSHHHEEEGTVQQSSHHHEEEGTVQQSSHHHEEAEQHESKDSKDNCCHDKVVKLAEVDKAVPQSSGAAINLIFVTAFISTFYYTDVLTADLQIPNTKYLVRSYHPPIPDIRLAIQSFQI